MTTGAQGRVRAGEEKGLGEQRSQHVSSTSISEPEKRKNLKPKEEANARTIRAYKAKGKRIPHPLNSGGKQNESGKRSQKKQKKKVRNL